MRSALLERAAFGWNLLAAMSAPAPAATAAGRIAARVRARDESFLSMLERDFWSSARGPYRELLEIAAWNPRRVRASVERLGLEVTLAAMAQDGVHLESDEAKGRRPLVRHGRTIRFAPPDLEAVRGPAVPLSTSGSSGSRTTNPIDLDGFRLQASYMPTMLEALGARARPLVLYYPALSASGVAQNLSFALAGWLAEAWFCHLPEGGAAVSQWRLWSLGLRVAARLRGVGLPRPRLAEILRPAALVDWIARHAPRGATVATFPGTALRVRSWVKSERRQLPPLTWILGGEPISARKRRLLEADGDRVYPWYGAVDFGRVAIGCLAPESADDMHLLTDRFAAHVARLPDDTSSVGRGRLLLTSLVPEVHRRMLNLDSGDRAELRTRTCGCPFESLGLVQHVAGVHSTEKLTLDGVTLAADLVQELADELLPAACGGSPEDFQLVEAEGNDGLTRLIVRVHPSLTVDPSVVEAVVHRALVEASGRATAMADRLRDGQVIEVHREAPRLSRGGKALATARARV
jgi:hypothetical protein